MYTIFFHVFVGELYDYCYRKCSKSYILRLAVRHWNGFRKQTNCDKKMMISLHDAISFVRGVENFTIFHWTLQNNIIYQISTNFDWNHHKIDWFCFSFLFFAEQKMSINPGSYKLSEKTGKLTSAGKFRIINKHTALSWGAMIIRQYANVFAIALRYLNPWFAIIQLIFRHAPQIIVHFERYRHISFFYETTFHPNSFTFNLII